MTLLFATEPPTEPNKHVDLTVDALWDSPHQCRRPHTERSTSCYYLQQRHHHTHCHSISHYVAWIITLLWTGVVNYFILKKLWTFGGKNKVGSSEPASTKAEDPEIGRRGH